MMSDELCMNCGFPIVAGEWRATLKDGQSVHLSNTNCMLRLVAHRDKMVEMRDAAISQRDVAEVRMARAEAELDIERDRTVAAENELQRVYGEIRRVEAERDELRRRLYGVAEG